MIVMKQNTYLSLMLLLASVIAGCASANKAAVIGTVVDRKALERQTSPTMEGLNPQVDVIKNSDGTYTFTFSASASGTPDAPRMSALRGITRATFAVRDRSGNALDSLTTTDIPTSGVTNDGVASLTATASVNWRPRTPPSHGSTVVLRTEGTHGTLVRAVDLPDWASPPMDSPTPLALSLDLRELGRSVEFQFNVRRVAVARPGEFLPSGERYRIELIDDANNVVWSSSANKMFTQAVTAVFPENVGEEVTYREVFDGTSDETRGRLAPGRYRVVATVPSKPQPYVLREEFTWGG